MEVLRVNDDELRNKKLSFCTVNCEISSLLSATDNNGNINISIAAKNIAITVIRVSLIVIISSFI